MLATTTEIENTMTAFPFIGKSFWGHDFEIKLLPKKKIGISIKEQEKLLIWSNFYKTIEQYLSWETFFDAYETYSTGINILEIPDLLGIQIFTKYSFDVLTPKEKNKEEIEQEALMEITAIFGKFKDVQSIYVERFREELKIMILLSVNKYNYDLMDELFDVEYEIRKKYSEIVFEFFYPPTGIKKEKDFIHPEAECIFSK